MAQHVNAACHSLVTLFDSWDPREGKREPIPASCPQTSTSASQRASKEIQKIIFKWIV